MGDGTGGRQNLHAAGGEPLRRADGPGQGQLQHQIRAVPHGGLRPDVLAQDGSTAPLDELSAHGADHGGARTQRLPDAGHQARMAGMQGIILSYDTSDLHIIHPDSMTKK